MCFFGLLEIKSIPRNPFKGSRRITIRGIMGV